MKRNKVIKIKTKKIIKNKKNLKVIKIKNKEREKEESNQTKKQIHQ